MPTKHDLQRAYPDRFSGSGKFPGTCHISLKDDAEPRIHPPRKYPIHLRDELKAELDRMETLNVISKVTQATDWVSSLAFSRKANGNLRVCLDPKDLNRATKRTYHKTPTLEEITHQFNGATVFSKLDARHGYWSIVLDEQSSLLTTFNSPFGRYKFNRLPFGLKVSQDLFQEKMDVIISQCPGAIGIADDIVVYGKDAEDHEKNLQNLMEKAREYGLVFNIDKCEINAERVFFFGCYYDREGIHADPEKVEGIRALPAPETVKELQQFLGMVNYMSPFIPNLASRTEPLRALMRKDSEWQWTSSHQQAFDELKNAVATECTLTYFDTQKPTVIQVDASMKGLGAALLQDGKPIAFASKALTEAEQRYANIERELLAVVFGCTRFHTYLYGADFKVESDHKPLENIQHKSLASTPPRLQRMMLRLQPYDYTITYKPGSEMLLADAMSRLSPTAGPQIDLDTAIYAVQFSTERLSDLQTKTCEDPMLGPLIKVITNGWPDHPKGLPKHIRQFWSCRDELSIDDGLVIKGERIMIPGALQQETLLKIHSGHQGINKCQLRAKACVYWPGITKEIEDMIKCCTTCQKHQKAQASETLMPHEVPDRPWHTVGTDLFHFGRSEYLIIADYYSKFPVVRRVSGHSTSAAIVQITKQVFSEQGIPVKVISDNGPQYASQEYRQFAEEWCFDHITSSPGFPQSNGFIERQIQTVKSALNKASKSNSDPYLAMLCLRTTPIDTVLPSPGELLNCRQLRDTLPTKIKNKSPDKKQVMEQLKSRQSKQKKYHDRNARDLSPLQINQRVTVLNRDTGRWIPAVVKDICKEPRSYIIELANGQRLRLNRKHIRECKEQTQHVWFQDKPESYIIPRDHGEEQDNTIMMDNRNANGDDPNKNTRYVTRSGRNVKKPTRLIESI